MLSVPIAAVMATGSLWLAVGVGAPQPSGAAVNAGSIAIGYENNGADPSIISVANKYFQKELGSKVQLKLFSSGVAALTSLASGQLPFMCGLGFPPVISAIAQGVPLQVVYNQERYTTDAGLVVRASTGIKSVKALAGKSVGLVIGSQSSFELATYAKAAGLNLAKVKQVNLTPPEMQSAWTTGTIDAAVVWDPVYDFLVTHGGRVLTNDAKLPVTATSYNICVANKAYAAAHPAVAEAFVRALGDGVTYLKDHPVAAYSAMAKAAGISVATAKTEVSGYQIFGVASQSSKSVLGKSSATAGSSGTAQSLLNNWKALYAAGTVTTKPPSSAAKFVNPTYAVKAG
jgi:NitT/TauT family transport system substrate-binding protein/taurine transport system substrate-binding protein